MVGTRLVRQRVIQESDVQVEGSVTDGPGPGYWGLRGKGEHDLSNLRRIDCLGRCCGRGRGPACRTQNLDGAFLPSLLWVDTVIIGTM